ncbi:MAG TPA: hypothetical protein VHV08_04770 [Pirellulales bacterium]|nr:hypothetical protein [Pirellulales bacterium]
MKITSLLVVLALLVVAAGCNPGADGVGAPYSSGGGTGGQEAGPTGTQGDAPADNPAAETPGANGTGTDAPSK